MKKVAYKEKLMNDYESDDYFLDEVYEGPLEEPIIVEYEYDLNQFNKYLRRKKIQLKQWILAVF